MSLMDAPDEAIRLQIPGFRRDLSALSLDEMPGTNKQATAADRLGFYTFWTVTLLAMPEEMRLDVIEEGKRLLHFDRRHGYPKVDEKTAAEFLDIVYKHLKQRASEADTHSRQSP